MMGDVARRLAVTLAPSLMLLAASCGSGSGGQAGGPKTLAVTIATTGGAHVFLVEQAKTAAEQERGLMFRTRIAADGGMLFWPYPPEGGAPRVANFWMKNTPSPLDIAFIRPDGTIARIAENAVPFDETPLSSGEPIAAVLELRGGRAAELGIAEGQKVSWPK
ncbi:DUF192 domain-containing protein [uncultured Sphingomonas sp.]|uniref:DUF192 domain-containing protein n=1 Tax=uncultured Sphingomonas sp. TaxID=158754 RepID=UPI0035C94D49